MSVEIKSDAELRLMREAGLVCAEILEQLCERAKPGVSTWELDEFARAQIARHGVQSAFLGYYGYPAVLCTSINHVIVHGIPSKSDVLRDGDIIGIDFGIFRRSFCADTARTVLVGAVDAPTEALVKTTQQALQAALGMCRTDARLGDIGATVQTLSESHGYGVVRDFVGHGIGRRMHEAPSVPNYGVAGTGKRLKHGLVLAVEPMVNAGTPEHEVLADKWTAVTKDGKKSAHFEHTVAVTKQGPWVLTRMDSEPGNVGQCETIRY